MGGDMGGNGRCLAMQRHHQPAGRGLKSRIRSPSSSTTSTHARLRRRLHNAPRPPIRLAKPSCHGNPPQADRVNLREGCSGRGWMRDSEPTASAQLNRPSRPPDRPKEETARLGDAIYQREIRAKVEADPRRRSRGHRRREWRLGHRRQCDCRHGPPLDQAPGCPMTSGACASGTGRCINLVGVPCRGLGDRGRGQRRTRFAVATPGGPEWTASRTFFEMLLGMLLAW